MDLKTHAEARSAVYSALALGFSDAIDDVTDKLASEDGASQLAEALSFLDVDAPVISSDDDIAQRHFELFGPTVRGTVPPFETEYGRDSLFVQVRELADLSGFYEAFGLNVGKASHERADHVRTELEFMAFLAAKEAYALEQTDAAMLEETAKAQRLFMNDHIGRFTPAFAGRLEKADRGGFYGGLGHVLGAFIESECERLKVDPGPPQMSLRVFQEDVAPAACGSESCGPEDCPG